MDYHGPLDAVVYDVSQQTIVGTQAPRRRCKNLKYDSIRKASDNIYLATHIQAEPQFLRVCRILGFIHLHFD